MNAVSAGGAAQGLTPDAMLGKRLWDHSRRDVVPEIKDRLMRCVLDGVEQEFVVDSETKLVERWSVRYIPCQKEAKALVVADQIDREAPHIVLSPREVETLQFLIADMTIDEIAERHSIAQRTVRDRIERLKAKFDVRTAHGLVAAAMAAGYR